MASAATFSGALPFDVLRLVLLSVLGGEHNPAPDAIAHLKLADGLEICHLPDARNVMSSGRVARARFSTFALSEPFYFNVRVLHLKKTIMAMADVKLRGRGPAGTEEALLEVRGDEFITIAFRRSRTQMPIAVHKIALSSGALVVPQFQRFAELADNHGLECMLIAAPTAFKKVVEKLVKARGSATCRITVSSNEELAGYNEPGGLLIHITNGPVTMLAKFEAHGEVMGNLICNESKTYCFHQSGVAKVLACICPDIKSVKLCFVENGIHWLFYDFSLAYVAQHFSIVVNQSLLSEE